MILVVNKVDRPDARVAEVVHEVEELFLDLDADEHQIDFPIVYCNARDRPSRRSTPTTPTLHRRAATGGADGLKPLFELLLEHIPAPEYDADAPVPGAGHQPRRVAVRRPPRAVPRAPRHAAQGPAGRVVPRRRHHRDRPHHRALRHRGARPRRRRRGRPGRDHRDRRPRRRHHRRDARRSRRPAPAARHPRRRPEPLDDDRHQHVAARRARTATSSPPAW